MIVKIANYPIEKIYKLIRDDLQKQGYQIDPEADPVQQWQKYYHIIPGKRIRQISGIRCQVVESD